MRVLVANKFWYRRGGLEAVIFDEVRWLEAAGHEVAHFSTAHPDNDPSPWSSYFVPYLELGSDGGLTARQKAAAAGRMFHNAEAARRFRRLLDDFRPQVVHAHGIHRQLSPSILQAARDRGVPVVETQHDFHHVCPADSLVRAGVKPCVPRACGRLCYGACVGNRCRDGFTQCALAAAETTFQRVRRVYERCVTTYVCPSEFAERVLVDGGWPAEAMSVLPNAVTLTDPQTSPGEYFLFAGRVVPLKGARIMLEAGKACSVATVVAGDGPDLEALKRDHPEATFTGWVRHESLLELARGARAVVVPSMAVENAPLSVLEAMAAGVAVIAFDVGGVSELVRDGREALLVPAGDAGALAKAMRRLATDADLAASLGSAARARAAERFSPAAHLKGLVGIYEAAIAGWTGPPSGTRLEAGTT